MFRHFYAIIRVFYTPDQDIYYIDRDCICSHKYIQFAQEIVTSNIFYCIIKQRLNNILIVLWHFDLNTSNFKKYLKLSDDDIEMSKHAGLYII